MIGRLTGKLIEVDAPQLLLDVGGVGYEVEVSAQVLGQVGMLQSAQDPSDSSLPALTLHTHFVVREDAQLLFGFHTRQERDLFRAFIKISGVGPKMGLALISSLSVQDLHDIVRLSDVSRLTRVPGVGKKTAERLLVELKNRLDDLQLPADAAVVDFPSAGDASIEAIEALIALGYREAQAKAAVAGVLGEADAAGLGVEDIVRRALRHFAQAAQG